MATVETQAVHEFDMWVWAITKNFCVMGGILVLLSGGQGLVSALLSTNYFGSCVLVAEYTCPQQTFNQ